MKKDIIQWITGCACFMAFISCSQTEEGVLLRNENGVYFSAQIASPATRATEQAFEAGDNISVFAFTNDQDFSTDAYAANVKYSYSDGAFSPVADAGIDYPANGGLAFWAIYPYCEQAASTFNFEVTEDQSTTATYGASDLMTASTSLTTEQNPVLSFYHRLACVKFKCSFEEAEEKVASITVNNVQRNVSINLTNNTYEGTGEATSGILPHRNEDGSYKILLPPQTIATGTSFMVVRTAADKEYTWKVPHDLLLASGCRYTYNLKVSAGGEITFSSSINPWGQEEEAIKKRVKQYTCEDFEGDMIEGSAYNYKYNEQGYPIDISGYDDATGIDSSKIYYSDHKITIENKAKYYFHDIDGSLKSEYRIDESVYTLDDKEKITKITIFNNGVLDSESVLSYTNEYLTEIIRSKKNGSIYRSSIEWTDGKMTKILAENEQGKEIRLMTYSSINKYKTPISICGYLISYHCCIGYCAFLAMQKNYLGLGMEYLPIKDDWTTWTWEVDADDYVTKITEITETTEDGAIRWGTTYTFTYENIE